MKTSKSFNQEYIEKAKTLIHEILEDKKEYDDWTQICFSMQNAVQAAANIWGISSDEQINKMRAFITEMVLIELSNLKQFDIVFKKKGIRSLDTLYCPKCGSNNVEERAWVNPNTDEISYNDSVEEEDCWCGICEEHVNYAPFQNYGKCLETSRSITMMRLKKTFSTSGRNLKD